MRIRSAGAYLALFAGLSVAAAGCGQIDQIRAMKAFKDANKLYAATIGAARPTSTRRPSRPTRLVS